MDLEVFCRHFYASRFLPIALYRDGKQICAFGFSGDIEPYSALLPKLLASRFQPSAVTGADSGLYGAVKIEDTDEVFVIGPAYGVPVTEQTVLEFIKEAALPANRKEPVFQILSAIPHYTYNRFLNLLAFLHYILNGKEISITEHFAVSDMAYTEDITSRHTAEAYTARDEQQRHGTYLFERQMLSYVMDGNTEKMRTFLLNAAQNEKLTEGRLADSALRQAKNIFIGAVTLVGKEGAIPGGMDIEQAYSLIDTYVRECERLQSIDAIKNLQFNMLIDFTAHVAEAKKPAELSSEIYSCMHFISMHINEPISLDDVAAHIRKSRAYTTAKFRRETGMSVNEYIVGARLQEAKTLLKYTEKPISEISEYLCFSSQPYFSSVFKKHFGLTPVKYREKRKS